VERDDRAAVATFFTGAPITPGGVTTLGEAAAHHARVKRLAPGDGVHVTDGAGRIGIGTIASIGRGSIDVAIERANDVERPAPIHLRVPIGDRDRMLWLAEKVTELGITTWQAVRFRRSASVSPRGEGDAFTAKLRARMIAALEQSGGAWLPAILPDVPFGTVAFGPTELPIVLHRGGVPLLSVASSAPGLEPVTLFGPEGGIERDELAGLVSAGWRPASLAATTVRFETAGVAAVAVIRAARLGGTLGGT